MPLFIKNLLLCFESVGIEFWKKRIVLDEIFSMRFFSMVKELLAIEVFPVGS